MDAYEQGLWPLSWPLSSLVLLWGPLQRLGWALLLHDFSLQCLVFLLLFLSPLAIINPCCFWWLSLALGATSLFCEEFKDNFSSLLWYTLLGRARRVQVRQGMQRPHYILILFHKEALMRVYSHPRPFKLRHEFIKGCPLDISDYHPTLELELLPC